MNNTKPKYTHEHPCARANNADCEECVEAEEYERDFINDKKTLIQEEVL